MIGILGGTFNPVHYGHLRAAVEVKEYFGLTELRLIPCAQPPHRQQPDVSASMRMRMLELAVDGQSGLIIDNREIQRAGQSYMIDTLRSLQQEFSNQSLLLFIGMDAFKNLTAWHHWQELFDVAHIVVMSRPSYRTSTLNSFFSDRLTEQQTELSSHKAGKLFFLPVTSLDISATAIRTLFAEKRNPSFLLPQVVIEFINQHDLYTQGYP